MAKRFQAYMLSRFGEAPSTYTEKLPRYCKRNNFKHNIKQQTALLISPSRPVLPVLVNRGSPGSQVSTREPFNWRCRGSNWHLLQAKPVFFLWATVLSQSIAIAPNRHLAGSWLGLNGAYVQRRIRMVLPHCQASRSTSPRPLFSRVSQNPSLAAPRSTPSPARKGPGSGGCSLTTWSMPGNPLGQVGPSLFSGLAAGPCSANISCPLRPPHITKISGLGSAVN